MKHLSNTKNLSDDNAWPPATSSSGLTLLETMVATALLAFVMLVLFQFFSNMQAAWTLSSATSAMYGNARACFDVIARDLNSAMAQPDDLPGQHFQFFQPVEESGGSILLDTATGNPSPIDDKLWFVTVGEGSSGANSSLLEVGYRLENHEVQRAFVDDSNPAWNVYGPRDDASGQDGYQRVIPNVMELVFECRNRHGDRYVPCDTAAYPSATAPLEDPFPAERETALPSIITVRMTLMDNRSFKLWEEAPTGTVGDARRKELERRGCRTFQKTIYLGSRRPFTL